jgi:hypothetical protein
MSIANLISGLKYKLEYISNLQQNRPYAGFFPLSELPRRHIFVTQVTGQLLRVYCCGVSATYECINASRRFGTSSAILPNRAYKCI